MSVTAATRDRLKAAAPVVAIAGDRAFREERPQGTALPAIVVHGITAPIDYTYSGPSDLQRARVQLDCMAESAGAAEALADAAVAAMDGPAVLGGIRFVQSFVADRRDDSGRGTAGSGASTVNALVFRASVDLFIWFKQA